MCIICKDELGSQGLRITDLQMEWERKLTAAPLCSYTDLFVDSFYRQLKDANPDLAKTFDMNEEEG